MPAMDLLMSGQRASDVTLQFSPKWRFIFLHFYLQLSVFLLCNKYVGMILSAMFVFFRDTQYLYDVFTLLLMYMSAIFYNVDAFSGWVQRLFLLNPVYCNIKYVRVCVLEGHLPSPAFHGLLLLYGIIALLAGGIIYKRYNQKFLYYV